MLDVSKQIQRGASATLGLNMDKLTDILTLNQVGAEIGNRKAHAVETITALLGNDAAHIVVANALRMNGAMIACAERDENGEFTDHGNLTLEVGKLFVEHIQIFDEGKSLQSSVAIGGNLFVKDKAGNKTPYMTLNGAVSAHSYEGFVYSTIGEGEVTVAGESELEKANRDVTRSVTYKKNYNMDPIKFYYADPDNSQLQFPGSIEEFKKSFIKAAFVKTKLSSLNQDLESYIDDFVREEQAGGMCLTRDSKAILDTYQNEMAHIMTDMQERTGQLDESQSDYAALTEGGMCMIAEAESADNYEAIHALIGSSDLYKTQESEIRDERIDQAKQGGIAHGNLKPLAQGINLAAKKYIEFAQKHPFLAERALDLFTIAVRAIAGLISGGPAGAAGGALSGVGSALAGEAVNKVAGEYIKSAMDSLSSQAAPELMAMDGSLTKEEADLLVRVAVLGALGGKELSDGIKLLSKSVKGMSVMKPAMAGGADLDNVDTHILEKKGHEGLAKNGGDGSKLVDDVANHHEPKIPSVDTADVPAMKPFDVDLTKHTLESKDPVKIAQVLKEEANWDINPKIFEKIPERFHNAGAELADSFFKDQPYGGIKYSYKKSDHIRIMQGDPNAANPSQRVDYVKVTYSGKTIGKDGQIVKKTTEYGKPKNHPDAHIPVDEWVKWKEIGKK